MKELDTKACRGGEPCVECAQSRGQVSNPCWLFRCMCVNVMPFQVHTIRTASKTENWIQLCKNTGNKTTVSPKSELDTHTQAHNTHHTNIPRDIWPDDQCSKNWGIQKALHPSTIRRLLQLFRPMRAIRSSWLKHFHAPMLTV